ncbi:MAG: DKNYY domain-containing protein [Cellvibrionaceae bacterium]
MNLKLKGADPKLWKLVEHNYSMDVNNIYYGNKIVDGADPDTFNVSSERSAKDKNNEYVGSSIKV